MIPALAPLDCRAGAATTTSRPARTAAAASTARPGESMPSSLVTKVVHRGTNSVPVPSAALNPLRRRRHQRAAAAAQPTADYVKRTTGGAHPQPDRQRPRSGSSRHGGLHGVRDDIGELTALAIDPALRGCAGTAVQHCGEQIFYDVELALLRQHRLDVIEQRAKHLHCRCRTTVRTEE